MIEKSYNPKGIEEKWYNFWLEKGYFYADSKSDKPAYCIVIPPPNVTGSLHIGHALDVTLQDIMIRYKRMCGFNTLWLPGTDHAGIATQNVVEKELKKQGLDRHKLGRDAFIKKVWEWKEQYGERIIHQLKRLGASCDWSRERFTLDEGLSRAVKEVFVRLYEEGLIYRGDYIINWCPRCHTALSDLEVEHEEKKDRIYYIKYSSLPPDFAVSPPHCLKKNGISAATHWSRMLRTHSALIGRWFGPDSPPTITHPIPNRPSVWTGSSMGSIDRNRTPATISRR